MQIVDGKAVYSSTEEEAAFKTLLETEVSGLKSKNSELLSKISQFKQFEGIDPNEYKALKENAALIEAEKHKAAGNWDAREKAILDAHAKDKAAWQTTESNLKKSVEDNVLKAQIVDAISKADGSTLLLSPHVSRFTKLDDNYQPVVVDEAGNIRVGSDGKNITISALIAEMKADIDNFGGAFKSSGAGGSGSQQSNGTGGSVFAKMNRTELTQAMNNPLTKEAATAYLKSQ